MKHLVERIVTISLVVVAAPLVAQDVPSSDNLQTGLAPVTVTLAVLPLVISTDDPEGADLGRAAFEKTLNALASTNGIRLLGPDTNLSFLNYELTPDNTNVILESLGAVAVLTAVVQEQGPTIAYRFSLHWPNEMRGYLAPLALDPQITIQGSDGQPMTVDTMLEMELLRLVNTIQTMKE